MLVGVGVEVIAAQHEAGRRRGLRDAGLEDRFPEHAGRELDPVDVPRDATLRAQEDERSRISRDLHDELGQELTALRFALERVKTTAADQELRERLNEICIIAENIEKSVDFLAWELRPALLQGVGLAAAMANYTRQWSHHAGIEIELMASSVGRVRFTPKVETNLYRIMQEALYNTHKHAKANKVNLILEVRDNVINLIIADDGRGFSLRSKSKVANGLGLTGMKERAALIGGTFEIESARGRGTTVYVKVPVAPKRKRKALPAATATNWHEQK